MKIYIQCPHCEGMVEILQINCGIFRHGIYKNMQTQLNPHAPENICREASKKEKIYGCGKPFKLEFREKEYIAIKCEYI